MRGIEEPLARINPAGVVRRDDEIGKAELARFARRLTELLAGQEATGGRMALERLAVAADVKLTTLKSYRLGQKEPGAFSVARLAKALGVSSDYLLGLTDDPPPAAKKSQSDPNK